ncbi:MAG: IS1634 family transposase [Mycoplasmatota bacterium]
MFIEKMYNNGYAYLRLVESERYTNDKGVRTVRKRLIYNIGPISKFDNGDPDYFQKLKDSFKAGHPIIDELKQFINKENIKRERYNITFSEGDPDCIGETKKYSHILIERILDELGLISLINSLKRSTKYEFDVLGFFRLLIYGRILSPASKIATTRQNNEYYQQIVKEMYEYNIYDTLDFINRYDKQINTKIHNSLVKKFNRKADYIFYDVTNFYFQIDEADEDVLDENGNIIDKGIRQNGVCKEERRLPIIQMGLFMDEHGYPISIDTFSGNTLDHQTLVPAIKNKIDDLNIKRFILIGDRGMMDGANVSSLDKNGHGWIIAKSIKKSAADKDWIFNEKDFIVESPSFKYKSKTRNRYVYTGEVIDGKKEKRKITEKVVVYWSEKYYKKQMNENKSFLEFLDKLEKSPSSFRITTSQKKELKQFFKKEVVNEETGEIFNSSDIKPIIDFDKVNKYKKQFGYYQIVTSELYLNEKEIIDKYHSLSRIENNFRMMKSDLETRAIYLSTKNHINAHLTTCSIALTVIRIIQNKIVEYLKTINKNNNNLDWELGLSTNRIQNALNKWTVSTMPNEYYRFNDLYDEDLQLIFKAFNVSIPVKLFKPLELKNLKTNIKII